MRAALPACVAVRDITLLRDENGIGMRVRDGAREISAHHSSTGGYIASVVLYTSAAGWVSFQAEQGETIESAVEAARGPRHGAAGGGGGRWSRRLRGLRRRWRGQQRARLVDMPDVLGRGRGGGDGGEGRAEGGVTEHGWTVTKSAHAQAGAVAGASVSADWEDGVDTSALDMSNEAMYAPPAVVHPVDDWLMRRMHSFGASEMGALALALGRRAWNETTDTKKLASDARLGDEIRVVVTDLRREIEVQHRRHHRGRSVVNVTPAQSRLGLPSHGIDVAALTRAADEVLVLTRAEELRQMAVEMRDAAVAKQRRKYRKRWSRYFECELCLDRPPYAPDQKTIDLAPGLQALVERCAKCDGVLVLRMRDL